MTPEPPSRQPRRPRSIPSLAGPSDDDSIFNNLIGMLAEQMGQAAEEATAPRSKGRRVRRVSVDYGPDPRTVHDMAGDDGYSLASNWFLQMMAKAFIANSITKSQIAVFLYVAGGQELNTGIAAYTQQEITDGLNELAAQKPGAKQITRPTVNRAVKALCEYRWLEPAGNGRIRLNVRLVFAGNSLAQHEVLTEIALAHDNDPNAFPHRIGPADVPHQEAIDLGLDGYDTAQDARGQEAAG
ncbi:hypothetical protein ACIBBE_24395 [Streptomyces sp. NPDC051644]|uniref:hypothetical protein n=1 Tax=Streptomyces sp. NPDC051644 TaxID=3365666 RepID=UPI0037971D1A